MKIPYISLGPDGVGLWPGICYRGAAKEYWPVEEREQKKLLLSWPPRPCRVGWSLLLWWATAGLGKGLMVEGCTMALTYSPSHLLCWGTLMSLLLKGATGTSCFIVLHRYWIFRNCRSVTTLCQASLLEPFFQKCLLTLWICAMFWWFL